MSRPDSSLDPSTFSTPPVHFSGVTRPRRGHEPYEPKVKPSDVSLRSERLTGALFDRLTHHVHILAMNGDSYRLQQSKQRRRQT